MNSCAAVAEQIRHCSSAVVACHIEPDGDAIGSLLAMGLLFRRMGKPVALLSQDGVPERFRFLPLANEVTRSGSGDLAISVDAASLEQLGQSHESLRQSPRFAKIDHHAEAENFGTLQWVDTAAAAVGEMLVALYAELNMALDAEVAACLLTAIVTDSGSFRFANTRPQTFYAAAKLLETGVPFAKLAERIYWDKPFSSARLTGQVMSRAERLAEGRVVWSYLTNADFVAAGGRASDVDHLSNELRSIDGVQVAALLRESPEGEVRVSLRARDGVDVAVVAGQFRGGGHRNAAGCRIASGSAARDQLLNAVIGAVKRAEETFLH